METKVKVCTKCGKELEIENFRVHKTGFILNQCKHCESEATRNRRKSKTVTEILSVTTKSGRVIEAFTKPISGGRRASSPNTEKVLFFKPGVARDQARIAFSAFANVPMTGIQCPIV